MSYALSGYYALFPVEEIPVVYIEDINDNLASRFVDLIAHHTGIKVRSQEQHTLISKIYQRMKELKIGNPQEYYQLLANSYSDNNNQEWQNLVLLITNIESYFFRDRGQFNLLRFHILPEIIKKQELTRQLKIWSAGCSTGEEPYSLAILIQEMIPNIHQWNVKIIATDINTQALAKAKHGVYNSWSFRIVPAEVKAQYFEKVFDDYKIKHSLKRLITFEKLNLVYDLFPSVQLDIHDFDLIICRNVFIYFDHESIAKVVHKFFNCLKESGYLLTGHAELYGQNLSDFKTKIFPESVIYQHPEKSQKTALNSLNPPTMLSYDHNLTHLSSHIELLPTITPTTAPLQNQQPYSRTTLPYQPKVGNLPPKQPQVDIVSPHDLEDAQRLVQQKSYRQAQTKLDKLLKQQPRNYEAHLLKAQIYANLGKYEKASSYCHSAIALDSFAIAPYYLLAQIAEEQGNVEEAKRLLKKVIYLDSSSLTAYCDLGNLYQQEGDHGRAQKMYETALNLLRQLPPDQILPEIQNLTVADLMAQLDSKLNPN